MCAPYRLGREADVANDGNAPVHNLPDVLSSVLPTLELDSVHVAFLSRDNVQCDTRWTKEAR